MNSNYEIYNIQLRLLQNKREKLLRKYIKDLERGCVKKLVRKLNREDAMDHIDGGSC